MYHAHKPTTEQKAAAMNFYATDLNTNAFWDAVRNGAPAAERAMQRMEAEADRAQTLRDETAKAAYKVAVEFAPRAEQRIVNPTPAWVLAGNATFTVVSLATGTRFTYRVRQPDADKPWFVGVLTGSDNESSYTFLGTIFADGTYRHGARSAIGRDAPSAKAAAWFFTHLADPAAMAKCAVYHEGKCCRCGRKLTVPSSIESGIGPECATKM